MRILIATSMLAFAMPASAQDASGVPAFRVPIGGASTSTGGNAVYAWMQNVATCSNACGSGTRATTYQCQDVNSYDFSGGGYGAPEPDASCAATSPKPAGTSVSCTNYSGCTYDWVKPAPTIVRIAKPGNPAGGTFPIGAVDDCSYSKRTFAPYCRREGPNAVTLPSGDHAFCSRDLPDYADVAAKAPDALGYDREVDVSTACIAGGRDNEWVYGAWNPWSSECSTTATRSRSAQCTRKFNGASLPESQCAGLTKDSSQTQSVLTSCTFKWNAPAYGAYPNACSANATRTRAVDCRRSDGQTVADSQCSGDGAKPSTTESGPVYTSCTYSWGTPTAWSPWANGCSSNTTRSRTVSCMRSDGTAVSEGSCGSAGAKPATTETGPNYASCTYTARDMGRSACTNNQLNQYWDCTRQDGQTGFPASYCGKQNPEVQTCTIPYTYTARDAGRGACSNGSQPQYWDCTRNDGQTGFPASYCGKTNPENVSCPTTPPPSYTYTAVNRGETPCSNGSKTVYWDCTRNDGVTGFAASNCGKTNPETQSCPVVPPSYTYTPVNRGETACANNSKTVYWDCTRNDGATGFPASMCGKTNPETQSCPTQFSWSWQTGGWSGYNTGCPGNSTLTRSVTCVRNDGYVDSDQFCNAGTRPASTQVQACQYSWNWQAGGWSAPSGGCPGTSTRTRGVTCVRNDGYVDSDQFCNAGTRPTTSETTACQYSWNWATSGWSAYNSGCSGSATRTRTVLCQRNDGYVDSDQFCNAGTRPGASETTAVYSSCTYASQQDGGFTSCQNGTQSAALRCQRSDGTYVANSNCGTGDRKTQSCSSDLTCDNPPPSPPNSGEPIYACSGTTIGYYGTSQRSGQGAGSSSTGDSRFYDRGYCLRQGGTCWVMTSRSHSEYGVYDTFDTDITCTKGGGAYYAGGFVPDIFDNVQSQICSIGG